MIVSLNQHQANKLADLCMDLAKGLLLAAILAPSLNTLISIMSVIKALVAGVFFVFISLTLLNSNKEEL